MSRAGTLAAWNSRLVWSGGVLGVGFSGFFDGILLHQVLQWHHLLSLVPGESLRRIETQIFADGAFHVLMYVVTLAGLWMLWRARKQFAEPGSGRRLIAAFLLGFAVWNVIDVAGFHWLLRIHRIRVDVPVDDRLRWDLLWLALFAAPPFLAALAVARQGGSGRGPAVPATLAVLVFAGGALAMRAPERTVRTVLFRPDMSATEVFNAVAATEARVVWSSPDGRLVSVELPPGGGAWSLYARGALAVGGPGSPAACLNWAKPA